MRAFDAGAASVFPYAFTFPVQSRLSPRGVFFPSFRSLYSGNALAALARPVATRWGQDGPGVGARKNNRYTVISREGVVRLLARGGGGARARARATRPSGGNNCAIPHSWRFGSGRPLWVAVPARLGVGGVETCESRARVVFP